MKRVDFRSTVEKTKEMKGAFLLIFIEILILAGIVAALTAAVTFLFPDFTTHFSSVESFESFMSSHRKGGCAAYIGVQMLQIIISVIPGQIVQIAGGYLYGFALASLLSLIGTGLGSAVAFYIARIFGQGPVKILAGQKALDQCSEILDSRTSYRIIFFLYLIPGFPKDILAYGAGLSRMRFRTFLPLATIVRYPAMAASMLIGVLLSSQSYTAAGIMIFLCFSAFGLCFLFREKLIALTDRYFQISSGRQKKQSGRKP